MSLPRTGDDRPGSLPRITVVRSVSRQSLLIALVCLALDTLQLLAAGRPTGPSGVLHLGSIVLVDLALALPVRTAGRVALVRAGAEIVMALVPGPGPRPLDIGENGSLIVSYRAGAWLSGRWSHASLAALIAAPVAVNVLTGRESGLPALIRIGVSAALPWMVGRWNTAYRKRLDDRMLRQEIERRDAAAAVERAVAQERTVIARDLHDVISHHVSAIGVHAGAARIAMNGGGASGPVGTSLRAVETAGRAAMADLRAMLDVLHGTADGATQPGLSDLDELVCRSGARVTLTVRGRPPELPESSGVALYRIAQEMLTNAVRYGGNGPVGVELLYQPDAVTLTTRNDIAAPAGGSGRGLTGIRTRAGMMHGTVTYGPADDGRWATSVTVPVRETP